MLRRGRLACNHLTSGPKAMARMMDAKRSNQSFEPEHHVGYLFCGVPRTPSPENPLDRAHSDQPRHFAGSRCPALVTTWGLANCQLQIAECIARCCKALPPWPRKLD